MIKLTDKYYIGFEPMNIILKEKTIVGSRNADTKNAGQERFLNISFHNSLESLVSSLIKKEIFDSGDTIQQLQDIVDIIKETEKNILENLKEKNDK